MVEVKKCPAGNWGLLHLSPKPLQIYFSNTIQGQLILKLHIHAFVLDMVRAAVRVKH
jgi:hypothetical protein